MVVLLKVISITIQMKSVLLVYHGGAVMNAMRLLKKPSMYLKKGILIFTLKRITVLGMVGKIKSLNEINRLEGKEYEMLISHMSVICELYSMFFKRGCFEGENEYRFVFATEKKQEISFRSKNRMVIPYIKKQVESIDFITRITIGPTNQIDITAKGISELLHYYQRDVDIVKSEIPLRF